MKKIFAAHLPYAPQLDELETAEVANCLEEVGTRFSVESLLRSYRPPTPENIFTWISLCAATISER